MSVDSDILPGLFVQRQLQVGMGEIQFCEFLTSCQCCKEILWLWQRILLCLQSLIHRHLVVPTNAQLAIFLRDRDDWNGLITRVNCLKDACCLQTIQFLLNQCLECKGHGSRFEKPWSGIWLDLESGLEGWDCPQLLLEQLRMLL